jgi:uncharacterized protein YggE
MNTKRVLFVCAALIGTTGLAGAQPLPLRSQGTPATADFGITVQGHGSVHVRPDSLRFTAFLPSPGPKVTRSAYDAGVAAIVAALRKDGVADAGTSAGLNGVYLGANGGAQMIVGSLRTPTRERAMSIYTDAAAAAAPYPAVVANIQFTYGVDDCAPVEAKALALAIADARRRAEALAQASNVKLGGVINVTEVQMGDTCRLVPDNPATQGVTGDVSASLAVTTTVTFAIDRSAK